MKVLIKYSTFLLVILCFNLGLAETISICSEPLCVTQEPQFTQHHTQSTRQAINNFYDHCPEMPCDIVHHSLDVPAAKYILRSVNLSGRYAITQDFLNKKHTHLSLLYSYDPISYYVFGLRKIVI